MGSQDILATAPAAENFVAFIVHENRPDFHRGGFAHDDQPLEKIY